MYVRYRSAPRNQTQDTAISGQFVPGKWFLLFDFGVYAIPPVVLRTCYALPSTETGHLRLCYAMSGTENGCLAYRPAPLLCAVRYLDIVLHLCYVMSGISRYCPTPLLREVRSAPLLAYALSGTGLACATRCP
eukprot:2332027-Rhodomonas_salina.1